MPLFGLGIALAVVGFYFAFEGGGEVGESAKREVVEAQAQKTPELEREGTVSFTIEPAESSWRTSLEQTQKAGVGAEISASSTKISMVVEQSPSTQGRYVREYRDVAVEAISADQPVPADLLSQIAQLVETVKHQLTIDSNGKVSNIELLSTPSGELSQFLGVITDASYYLSPHFPREAVNVDEAWSYAIPIEARDASGKVINGEVQVTMTFRGFVSGTNKRVAYVDQNLTGKAKGSGYEGHGIGKGEFWVDLDTKRVKRARVSYDQVGVSPGGQSIQSKVVMTKDPLE